MSKFKAGDKVRCVNASASGGHLVHGGEYISERDDGLVIQLQGLSSGVWSVDRFELVEPAPSNPSPVRKVTRTEIVPGTYDGVELIDRDAVGFFIRYNEYTNAPELRNAARIFNEIAYALEQNKEAS